MQYAESTLIRTVLLLLMNLKLFLPSRTRMSPAAGKDLFLSERILRFLTLLGEPVLSSQALDPHTNRGGLLGSTHHRNFPRLPGIAPEHSPPMHGSAECVCHSSVICMLLCDGPPCQELLPSMLCTVNVLDFPCLSRNSCNIKQVLFLSREMMTMGGALDHSGKGPNNVTVYPD